mmetsp:Transcript_21223/g.32467  ORF Transcript_21223/g.32467 Transcript_21223/m.32467 type:complete len:136 (+) Transcript_21223:565-972(+)
MCVCVCAGLELMGHLGIEHGEEFVFADPENAMYNDLDLNRGVVNTFFNPATPFAFKDRLFKKDGMKDLFEVIGKWNKAFFIPPKQEQAFLQGGTFVFDDGKTILAHYDPSTAAHADIDYAVKLATDSVNSSVAAA